MPDPECHGLAGLHYDEGCEWVDDIAMDVLNMLHSCVHLLIFADDCTASHHVVALIELCQALDHHVAAMVQWPQDDGCGEGGVAHMLGTRIVGNLRDHLEVTHGEQGVGWLFAEDKLGIWLHGCLHLLGISEIDKGELHTEGREVLTAFPVRATIRAVGDHAMVTVFHGSTDCRGSSSHTCAESSGAKTILEYCELALECVRGRILRA